MMQSPFEQLAAEWEQKSLQAKIEASSLALDRALLKACGGASLSPDYKTPTQVAAAIYGWSSWAGSNLSMVKAEICATLLETAPPGADLDPPRVDKYTMSRVGDFCTKGYETAPKRALLVLARQVATLCASPKHLRVLVDTLNHRSHVRTFVQMELREACERLESRRPSSNRAVSAFLQQCFGSSGAAL